jgi:hypothetical protein
VEPIQDVLAAGADQLGERLDVVATVGEVNSLLLVDRRAAELVRRSMHDFAVLLPRRHI